MANRRPTAPQPLPEAAAPDALPPAAAYFPVRSGPYVMKAGLARLGTGFGNGAADHRWLQLDRDWRVYRANKLQARAESLSKYYCAVPRIPPAALYAVNNLIIHSLTRDYPQQFNLEPLADGGRRLHCRLSGETLCFDRGLQLQMGADHPAGAPPYRDALDALACQIQEDLALVSTAPTGRGQVLALHLCAPNHWAAADRVGRSFQEAHQPVPQFERIARHTPRMLENLRDAGPYVRFAWGLSTDSRLNHHPDAPPGWSDAAAWNGRRFDPAAPELFLRTERQALVGIPEAECFVFAIHTYFTPAARLRAQQRQVLAEAVEKMNPEIARYKGLLGQQEVIAAWLNRDAGSGRKPAPGGHIN